MLRVHKSYLKLITHLNRHVSVKGYSHITGGGIVGNTMRLVPKGMSLNIFWNNWRTPKIFKLIQAAGEITDDEMRSVFNLGIGLIAIVSKKDKEKLIAVSKNFGEKPVVVGKVV